MSKSEQLRDLYKDTFPGVARPDAVSKNTLAQWMGLDNILISTMGVNTGNPYEGHTGGYVFNGNHAFLLYVPEEDYGKWEPAAMRSFNWTGIFPVHRRTQSHGGWDSRYGCSS